MKTELIARAKMILNQEFPLIDLTGISNPDVVRKNVFVSVQRRRGQNNVIKRNFLNLELVVRMKVGEEMNILLPSDVIGKTELSIDEIWEAALENSNDFAIQSMSYILGVPMGENQMYVVTSKTYSAYGAAALAYPEVFENYCLRTGLRRIYILPSSTQELLIVPGTVDICPYDLAKMVRDVNESEVAPDIQLDPVVYSYSLDTNCVEIEKAGDINE